MWVRNAAKWSSNEAERISVIIMSNQENPKHNLPAVAAGTVAVISGSASRFPRGNDPAPSILRTTGNVRLCENLVGIRLLREARRAFQHHAILHP